MTVGTSTNTVERFNPWSAEVQDDLYPHYQWLRDYAPCFYVAEGNAWAISRYADVHAIARDVKTFVTVGDRVGASLLAATEPPQHTKTRGIVQPEFRRAVMQRWAERAYEVASELMVETLGSGVIEWKQDFVQPLVLQITAEMMGIPDTPDLMAKYPRWSQASMDDLDSLPTAPPNHDILDQIAEARQFFAGFITDRAREHRDEPQDLIDMLILHGSAMHTLDEISAISLTLLAAGNQNTADSLCHLLRSLHDDPEQMQLLQSDPSRAEAAIDEAVRHETPAQASFRRCLVDTEVHGETIPAGARVMLLWGAANRDERVFDRPELFDMRRKTAGHLGFGTGIHKCLGEPFARVEGAAVAQVIGEQVGRINIEGDLRRRNTSVVQGWDSVPVSLDPRY